MGEWVADAPPALLERLGTVVDPLDMERVNYQPAGPGTSWLPLNMRRWECSDCADALRSL
ncbi:hypothetical protein AB0L67_40155 [Streptomyces flaveolus]|uniref:hypothetical protein n=1 Tax=Streptomyces flaveolus TaxID=67297 RepID=UPI00342D6176